MRKIPVELFSNRRYDGTDFIIKSTQDTQSEHKELQFKTTTYQEDIQRIIYSSGFRRLQNKTQVHPLPNSDYLRNRLTHSLEVSEIGQIIAQGVALHLQHRGTLPPSINPYDVKDIVASACLIHDLGNPPFGHNGEEAIQSWFARNKNSEFIKDAFKNEQTEADMLNYDGNAQTFRMICKLQNWREKGGLRLSLATIGTSVKYPWASTEAISRNGKPNKFGFLRFERGSFDLFFRKLGLVNADGTYKRHPLAYIMEAADDIAYLTTDIEDGVKSGSIEFDVGRTLLHDCSDRAHQKNAKEISPSKKDDHIGYLRTAAISNLAEAAVETFLLPENLESIIEGSFSGSLLDSSEYKSKIKAIREECVKNLYNRRDKLLIEAGGHHVIETLLDFYMNMAAELIEVKKDPNKLTKKSRNLFHLLPEEVRENNFSNDNSDSLVYKMVDYVSGMTDTYAVATYRRLTGSSLHRI